MRAKALLCVNLAVAFQAAAQSATVRVTHDDPDGIVTPGQVVQITATVSWTGLVQGQLARIAGDLEASPDIGTAANPTGLFPGYSTPDPQFTLGAPIAGSIRGQELNNYPAPFFQPISLPPWANAGGILVVGYEWTAPATLGPVNFNWLPRPDIPLPLFYLDSQAIFSTPLPTSYIGTTLTVIPAPSTLAPLLGALVAFRPRRAPRPVPPCSHPLELG